MRSQLRVWHLPGRGGVRLIPPKLQSSPFRIDVVFAAKWCAALHCCIGHVFECNLSYPDHRVHHFLPADAGHATELLARFAFLNSTPTLAMLQNHISYIIVRLLIGFGLATFVCCQFWTSIMFAPTVVGMANAISGGWGNAGQQPRLRLSVDTMMGDCATTLLSTGSCSLLQIGRSREGCTAWHGTSLCTDRSLLGSFASHTMASSVLLWLWFRLSGSPCHARCLGQGRVHCKLWA